MLGEKYMSNFIICIVALISLTVIGYIATKNISNIFKNIIFLFLHYEFKIAISINSPILAVI